MGQNSSKGQWAGYSSQQYFQRQVQFYRWRADPCTNTHICRVSFLLQDSVRDRQKLKSLLEHQFSQTSFISINDIMRLADQDSRQPLQEIMAFQNYACPLSDLEERLTLPETLYTLHSLFSGYEVLLAKLGKLHAKAQFCFVTVEGEVRAWFNQDYKSNEGGGEWSREGQQVNSQIGLIKRILQIGERLSANPTEFLHFSRQFRSFMERDILQNWTLVNARKLINSYVYTYKLSLPNNLKQTLRKRHRGLLNTTTSDNHHSQISYSGTSSYMPTKTELLSTGEPFYKNASESLSASHLTMYRRDGQRPISLSEHSSKKSEEISHNSCKTHSKKFSSTDLKNMNERGRQYESPKGYRSQMSSSFSNHDDRKQGQRQMINLPNSYAEPGQRVRRQRQFALTDDFSDKKVNTTQVFSPVESRGHEKREENYLSFKAVQDHKQKTKQNVSQGILKQHQFAKQKKKLEKKAATVSKYITFYQQTRNLSKAESSIPEINPDIVKELSEEETSKQLQTLHEADSKKQKQANLCPENTKTDKVCIQRRQISIDQDINLPTYSFPVSRKPSFEGIPTNNSFILPFKGKTECFSNRRQEAGDKEGHDSSEHHNFTIKTLNKLVDNKEVSLHESNGSFMSIPQSEGSEYNGVLSKMGRSVDIMNLPSNKHVTVSKKVLATSNNLQKVYNYY